jgi:hypothetical protein
MENHIDWEMFKYFIYLRMQRERRRKGSRQSDRRRRRRRTGV